jgi:hypothetical protein
MAMRGEHPYLPVPQAMIEPESRHEYDRMPSTDILNVQPHAFFHVDVGH